MSAGAAIIVLWFLFCGWLAWKCVDLIRNAAPPDDDSDHNHEGPIDYRRFRQ